MASDFLHSCSDLNSTASVTDDGDPLAPEVNVGIIVGAVGENTLVIFATGNIGPSPVVEVSTGIDKDVAFLDDVFADFTVGNTLRRDDSATTICILAGDDPLLFLVTPDGAGNLAGYRDIFSQIELLNYVIEILKNLWSGDIE